jgi:glycosyltransferase involved in cell wall biosynthesis
MHILLISTSYPDQTPGSEAAGSFVAEFAEGLARHLRVSVLAPGSRDDEEHRGNLVIHRFAVPKLPLSLLTPKNPSHWGDIFKTISAGQKAVEKMITKERFDHILALWALPSGYWARTALKRQGISYSTWTLGSDIWAVAHVPLIRNLLKSVLRQSQHRFADGYLLMEDVERLSGERCEFLPSCRRLPVSEDKKLATSPPYKLAFLGRWHPNKGIDILMDSLLLLNNQDWEKIGEVRIFGGGPLEERVISGHKKLEASGRPVRLGGYLGKKEAAELLLWADYLLLPSRIESIPVIFSDAMQARCPIIATPVGDLPRLFNTYKVGNLATKTNPLAFAMCLTGTLEHPPAEFHGGLFEAAKEFDISSAVQHLLNTLQLR